MVITAMEVRIVGKWLGMPLHIQCPGTPLWTDSIPTGPCESKWSKLPDVAEEPPGWCNRKCGRLEGRRPCLAEHPEVSMAGAQWIRGPVERWGQRSRQGPDCTDLLGHGKGLAFYSKYQWMPVEDFRQKNDTIWKVMLKDNSNSYAEKRQQQNKNEIQEIS